MGNVIGCRDLSIIHGGTPKTTYTETYRSARERIYNALQNMYEGAQVVKGRADTVGTDGLCMGNIGREAAGKPVGSAQSCS